MDTMSNLWVSEWSKGIAYMNLTKSKFKTCLHSNNKEEIISIDKIIEDRTGQLWCISGRSVVYVIQKYHTKNTTIDIASLKFETNQLELRDILCDDFGRIFVFSRKA